MLGRGPLHFALIMLAILWLVPTVGLLVTSFRPRADIQSTGWWEALFDTSWTLKNYDLVLEGRGMGHSFINSALIAFPSTIFPLFIGSLAALRSRGSASRSGHDLPVHRRADGGAAPDAFVPILIEFQDLGEFSSVQEPARWLVLGHLDRAARCSRCRSASSSYVTASSRCRAT